MIERCFISSISSMGYVSLLKQEDFDDERLFSVNFMPQKNVEYLVEKYSGLFSQKGLDVQIILNPLDTSTAGLIVPQAGVGFVSFWTYEHGFFKDNSVYKDKSIISAEENFSQCYNCLGKALKIHDEWEQVYIKNINFNVLNNLKNKLIHSVFDSSKSFFKDAGTQTLRFFGATTVDGAKDFLGEIVENFSNRYFIKGRPGSGKSTLLKALANASLKTGYDVKTYHCAFDPNSVDLIIIKDLDLCIFDSTPPHEYFPSRNDDHVIDIYEMAIGKEFDTKNEKILNEIKGRYSRKLKEAIGYLQESKRYIENFRVKYSRGFNDRKMKKIEETFLGVLSQL